MNPHRYIYIYSTQPLSSRQTVSIIYASLYEFEFSVRLQLEIRTKMHVTVDRSTVNRLHRNQFVVCCIMCLESTGSREQFMFVSETIDNYWATNAMNKLVGFEDIQNMSHK